MAQAPHVGEGGGRLVRPTPRSVVVTRVAEGWWNVTRSTKIDLSSAFAGWRSEILGCVFRPTGSDLWFPNVPEWGDSGYTWRALDTPGYKDANEAICVLLDRVAK